MPLKLDRTGTILSAIYQIAMMIQKEEKDLNSTKNRLLGGKEIAKNTMSKLIFYHLTVIFFLKNC